MGERGAGGGEGVVWCVCVVGVGVVFVGGERWRWCLWGVVEVVFVGVVGEVGGLWEEEVVWGGWEEGGGGVGGCLGEERERRGRCVWGGRGRGVFFWEGGRGVWVFFFGRGRRGVFGEEKEGGSVFFG